MAANLKPPKERFDDLTKVVSNLEDGFSTNFANWSGKKHAGTQEYFLWTYSTTVDTLRLITSEKWKNDVDSNFKSDLNNLFERALELLPRSVEHVRTTGPKLTRVHKGLLEAMLRLAGRGDVTVSNDLGVHLVRMGIQLYSIRPPPRGAWNSAASDLKGSGEFDGIFQEFVLLEKDPTNKQVQHELYVGESFELLERALRALCLPEHEAYPRDDFFHNETRPTFVEYPYGSKEFLYGRGSRPGILHIKSKLGSPLTDTQKKKLSNLSKEETKEAVKQKFDTVKKKPVWGVTGEKFKQINQKTTENKSTKIKEQKKVENTKMEVKGEEKTKEKTKGNEEGKGNKKRPKNDKSKSSKKPRTSWGYTMTTVNAAADVEDMLRVSKYKHLRDWDAARPDSNRLITPTVEIRKTTLVAYRDDLRRIIDEVYKRKFGMPTNKAKLPQTASEREAWLELADREMILVRARVDELFETATTPTKAKQLRLAAYRLKLIRSLHTLGLLSGEPATSAEEIREGLQDRLEDWILYEEAWNASELVTLDRQGITQELWDTIKAQVNERAGNVTRWADMYDELAKGSVPGEGGKGEKGQTFEDNDSDSSSSSSDEEEEEEEEEEDDEDNEEEEDDEDNEEEGEKEENDEMDIDEEKKEEEEEEVPNSPGVTTVPAGEIFLTAEEISNGQFILYNALHPKLPNAGDYLLDWREERRRRRWFQAMAIAKLTGKPVPAWTHKAPFDPFAAGGPPGWEGLPIETVWDRFQYMWVLTNWRFFQLRELEP
ncbi:hypothetical protein E0Z10_g8284 [Xylaria hypoxylon]|uniref:Uncharacterized protein n=1 Tax=Xylaria hypoxylon TaxID=37992 RepID=A0A4Z0Y8I6_9PEZI|nr:hypothetical protein E0Z10_g8284 [Xylaria hypoxylon]